MVDDQRSAVWQSFQPSSPPSSSSEPRINLTSYTVKSSSNPSSSSSCSSSEGTVGLESVSIYIDIRLVSNLTYPAYQSVATGTSIISGVPAERNFFCVRELISSSKQCWKNWHTSEARRPSICAKAWSRGHYCKRPQPANEVTPANRLVGYTRNIRMSNITLERGTFPSLRGLVLVHKISTSYLYDHIPYFQFQPFKWL